MHGKDTEIFGTCPPASPRTARDASGRWADGVGDHMGLGHPGSSARRHAAPLVLGFEDFESYPAPFLLFRRHARAQRQTASAVAASCSKARPINSSSMRRAPRISTAAATISPSATGRSSGGRRQRNARDHDPDGRAGYPGNCTITCTYTLKRAARSTSSTKLRPTRRPSPMSVSTAISTSTAARTPFGHDIMIAGRPTTAHR